MNTRLILVALVSTAMLGAYVQAQFGNQSAKLDTIKIKDDLFVIHNDFVPGNTTVLVTNEASCSWTTRSRSTMTTSWRS